MHSWLVFSLGRRISGINVSAICDAVEAEVGPYIHDNR